MRPKNHQKHHGSHGQDSRAPLASNKKIATVDREPKSEGKTANTKEYSPAGPRNDWSLSDKIGLVFDGVVCLVTVVGLVFLVLQWNQTDAALKEASAANDISRTAMQSAQRAWVTVQAGAVTPIPNTNDYAVVALEFGNSGQSPAVDMVITTRVRVASSIPAPDSLAAPSPSRSVLGRDAKSTNYVRSRDRISPDDLARLIKGDARIYAFGDIQYRDIFGISRETVFCLMSASDGKQIVATMLYCPQQNDAS